MDQIEEALAELRMQDKPRFSEVAVKYKVDRTWLSKHYHRIH
jgi:hypothetical protein